VIPSNLLKEVILSNQDFILNQIDRIFQREGMVLPRELNKTIVFHGVRRSGKTFLLYDFFRKNAGNSLYLDFEDDRLQDFQLEDFDCLKKVFGELNPHLLGREHFFFFDEVQRISGWERYCRRAVEREGLKIALSGSSSQVLPPHIHTALRGRAWSLEVLPFSFREFSRSLGPNVENLSKPLFGDRLVKAKLLLMDYLKWGGFPEVCLAGSRIEKTKLLQDYYQAMFFRDLVERHQMTNIPLLESLFDRMFSSFGVKFSLSAYYKQYREKIPFSKDLLYQYYRFILDSLLVYEVRLLAESTYRRMRNPAKIYLVDPGLARRVTSEDLGRVLENVVYIEFRRKGLEVFYFGESRECDFIVKNEQDDFQAFQVCLELNPGNWDREINGLLEACRFLGKKEGTILTLGSAEEIVQDGVQIRIVPVLEWLF